MIRRSGRDRSVDFTPSGWKRIVFILGFGMLLLTAGPARAETPERDTPGLRVGVAALPITPVDDQGNLWQEPYSDTNHNGRYDPPHGWRFWRHSDPFEDENGNGKWDGPFLAGFGHRKAYYVAKGVHDPIWARALVIRLNGKRIALVALDLVGLFYEEVQRIRRAVSDLDYDYVLVASTHTHSAPDSLGLWGPDPFTDGRDPRFMEYVRSQAAEAIRRADRSAVPARLTFARTAVPDTFGSLIHDKRDPIVIDDRLLALRATDESGRTLAILVNGASHPEALGGDYDVISSDFPHYVRRFLEEGGPPVQGAPLPAWGGTTVYFSGAVGGLMTPLGAKVRDEAGRVLPQRSFEKTQRIGEIMAWAVGRALDGAEPSEITGIAAQSRKLMLPVDNRIQKYLLKKGVLERTTYKNGNPAGIGGDEIKTEVGLITFSGPDGPAAQILAVPGELFPELDQGGYLTDTPECWKVTERKKMLGGKGPERIAAAHPVVPAEPTLQTYYRTPLTFLFGLANDELGYIVPSNDFVFPRLFPFIRYGKDRCGDTDHYEETRSASSWMAPAISESLIEMLIDSDTGR
jgi:hypothetical protein